MKRGIKRQKRTRMQQIEALETRNLLTGDVAIDIPGTVTFADGVEQKSENEWTKFSTNLVSVVRQYNAQVTDPNYDGGDVTIDVRSTRVDGNTILIRAIAATTADAVIADLNELGATDTQSFGRIVSARITLDKIESLESVDSILSVAAVTTPTANAGLTTSQGDAVMQSDEVRASLGFDGTGISVGILSNSFDALGGMAGDIANDDLPANVTILKDVTDPADLVGSLPDEGRAMAQIVHDVAPGADILFYTAWESDLDFALGILALAAAGADIIVDDVGYANEPWFQDGIIAQAIDMVVAQGVSYFTAAGNSGTESYQAAYQPSVIIDDDLGELHDFDPGAGIDTRQSVTIPRGTYFALVLQWDQPFASAGGLGSQSDYDIYLLDDNDEVVASSVFANVGSDAIEFLEFDNDTGLTSFHIVISKFSGVDATMLKYNVWAADPGVTFNEYFTNSGTAVGHVTAKGAAAVGAAGFYDTPEFGTNPPVKQSYSSVGGVPTYYDTAGNRLSTFEIRMTPDFVGPDDGNNTFFAFDVVEDADSFPNFGGTSAAAPHVAAVAALMLQKNSSLTPENIYDILGATATDMATSGPDIQTGYGLVNALAAVNATPGTSSGGGDGGSSGSTDACGVALPEGTTSFAGAVGANFFASTHAILDGDQPGQLGYDYAILDYLRGKGTLAEIAKEDYSIAVVGNGLVNWSFSDGTTSATGYERTDFYNIDYFGIGDFEELLTHDLVIVLSGENAVTNGMTAVQMQYWADAESAITQAVNRLGLDLWVGASGGDDTYYEFLPSGTLASADFVNAAPPQNYMITAEGSMVGITDAMAEAAATGQYFTGYDSDLFRFEVRNDDEFISVGAQGIAFDNDQLVLASDVLGGVTSGILGTAFQDLNLNGVQDAGEAGIAGIRFFIDYNGDGQIGLCEPTATSDDLGRFVMRSAFSGEFQILPVPTAGYVVTTDTPITVTINPDGSAEASSEISFGVIAGTDSGDSGIGGTVPIADGAFLGDSPVVDDGVFFGNGIQIGTNTISITSSVEYSNTVLNAWIDLNKDGDFNDAGEQIFKNVHMQMGTHDYTFVIPSWVFDDSFLPEEARLAVDIRFRVGPTLNIAPDANDIFGEIEDYEIFISQDPDPGLYASNDIFEYEDDTAGQYFNVLANDSSYFNRTLTIVPGSVTNISPVLTPGLDITVSPDGTRILFDATGVIDLTEDITFQYTVQDTAGNTAIATVTLVTALDTSALPVNAVTSSSVATFFNSSGASPGDVNNDGILTGQDLASVIAELRTVGSRDLPEMGAATAGFKRFIDVNGDGRFNNADLIRLLSLMRQPITRTEGESYSDLASSTDSAIETMTESTSSSSTTSAVLTSSSSSKSSSASASNLVTIQPIVTDGSSSATGAILEGEGELSFEPSITDQTLAAFGEDQSDLLWSNDDGVDLLEEDSSDASDDLFADDEWQNELISL
ncbi:S8 family serine peptidase [Bremerella sp. JC817]|uniref:S8 family serine peptidase n=1 Tax=Bremerella sp. JC817 TaxID=3231756 RepID=UPI00345A80A7